jgi:hypothetical protein
MIGLYDFNNYPFLSKILHIQQDLLYCLKISFSRQHLNLLMAEVTWDISYLPKTINRMQQLIINLDFAEFFGLWVDHLLQDGILCSYFS